MEEGSHFLSVKADPAFDIAEFNLSVMVDGHEYCNANRIYGDDGPQELSCQALDRDHTSILGVSAQTQVGDLRCERHADSDISRSIFACEWRT